MTRLVKSGLKIISAVISFLVLSIILQPFFVPKFIDDSTTIVKGYSYLEENSIDVLFLGASQMFCSVDAGRLSSEYNIKAYDFGASGQPLSTTYFYLREALKSQSPQLILVEVCEIFKPNTEYEYSLVRNYSPMNCSFDKFKSLYLVSGDFSRAFTDTFVPLTTFHDRWKTLNDAQLGGQNDIEYVIFPDRFVNVSNRGYLARDSIEKHEVAFFKHDYTERELPEDSKKAIDNIVEECKKKNIELVFFKAPVSNWTKGDSNSVKTYMKSQRLKFIDLNEKIRDIGINSDYDFYDDRHLNSNGAKKTTDYLAPILMQYLRK